MAAPVNIKDNDSGNVAKVTQYGQLVVAPLQYSTPITVNVNLVSTAFNFIAPEAGKDIVITDIIAAANRNVSPTTPANIRVFSATSATTTTADTLLLSPQLTAATSLVATGLNLRVGRGRWVSATTDDNDVLITVMFYRVPSEDV